jgi:putative transposase
MVIFSESMLRHVVTEYLIHYHEDRNHQGLNSKIIKPDFDNVEPREQLGGLLKYYGWKAA